MWKLIKSLGWGKKGNFDYDAIRAHIAEHVSPEDAVALREFIAERHNELYNRINEFEEKYRTSCGNYSGDDSFGDMIYHVIGLGKKAFKKAMKDPRTLDDVDFVECFSYAVPYDYDDAMEDKENLKKTHEKVNVDIIKVIDKHIKFTREELVGQLRTALSIAESPADVVEFNLGDTDFSFNFK